MKESRRRQLGVCLTFTVVLAGCYETRHRAADASPEAGPPASDAIDTRRTLDAKPDAAAGCATLIERFETTPPDAAWSAEGGSWRVWAGTLEQLDAANTLDQPHLLLRTDRTYRDFGLEVDLGYHGGKGAQARIGVAYRVVDARNYYLAVIAPDTKSGPLALLRMKDGTLTQLASAPVDTGTWHRLRLRVTGPSHELFLDGKPLLSHTDGALAAGRIGLATAGAESSFGELIVSCPSATPALSFDVGGQRTIEGSFSYVYDVHRSGAGTYLVASGGPGYVGQVWVSRSMDSGATWKTTALFNTVAARDFYDELCGRDNDLYSSRLFAIDGGTLGVTATQGSGPPYDAFLRSSPDDGLSWTDRWVNVSRSGDLTPPGNKASAHIIKLLDGSYLAAFQHTSDYLTRSPDLLSFGGRTALGGEAGYPVLLRQGPEVLLAVFHGANPLVVHASTHGKVFAVRGTKRTLRPASAGDLWRDPATGVIYACYVAEEAVYAMHSRDGGRTFVEETLLVDGLKPKDVGAACHVDGAGVTVAYKDTTTAKSMLLLPRAIGGVGHDLGCADGSAEEVYSANMVRCEVAAKTLYDQAVCGAGWHICRHGELLANRGSKAPPAGYWLNAHVRLTNTNKSEVHDSPSPACVEHSGACHVDETIQAMTDHDALPVELPYVSNAWGCSNNVVVGSCSTVKLAGAFCCR